MSFSLFFLFIFFLVCITSHLETKAEKVICVSFCSSECWFILFHLHLHCLLRKRAPLLKACGALTVSAPADYSLKLQFKFLRFCSSLHLISSIISHSNSMKIILWFPKADRDKLIILRHMFPINVHIWGTLLYRRKIHIELFQRSLSCFLMEIIYMLIFFLKSTFSGVCFACADSWKLQFDNTLLQK